MRITLTGRRLALAAVLVLGGAAAPLAYATIADGKAPAMSAAPAVPLAPASPTSVQAGTAVADNPYQVFLHNTLAASGCATLPLPAAEDFVLESVSFLTVSGAVTSAVIELFIKTGSASQDNAGLSFEVALDGDGDGTRAFKLVVRPDAFSVAGVGDVHAVNVCVNTGSPVTYDAFVTGQRLGSPTAARVASFDATSNRTGATLRWTTASETEILGFNIWRYRGAKGVKVNRKLVRAKRSGEPAGASYRYIDTVRGAKRGLTYRLQLVDQKGRRTWYAAFAIASK